MVITYIVKFAHNTLVLVFVMFVTSNLLISN